MTNLSKAILVNKRVLISTKSHLVPGIILRQTQNWDFSFHSGQSLGAKLDRSFISLRRVQCISAKSLVIKNIIPLSGLNGEGLLVVRGGEREMKRLLRRRAEDDCTHISQRNNGVIGLEQKAWANGEKNDELWSERERERWKEKRRKHGLVDGVELILTSEGNIEKRKKWKVLES